MTNNTAPKMTKMGTTLMTIIGKRQTSFFDGGIAEGEGIWHEALAGETAGAQGMPSTPTGVANVITKLAADGYLYSEDQGSDGVWVSLTKLGADVANQLAASKAAAPAKKATAKKATSKKPAKKSAQTLHTEQESIPTDPTQLKQLIKITRDRRWRAGRRGDDALVKAMDAKLALLTGKAPVKKSTAAYVERLRTAGQQAKKAAPAKKATTKKAAPANKAAQVLTKALAKGAASKRTTKR